MRNYLEITMKLLTRPERRSRDAESIAMHEEFADEQLLIGIRAEMKEKLRHHREKGRHGWWDNKVCSIKDLYEMREKALADNDHISVMNFTAMIAARESIK